MKEIQKLIDFVADFHKHEFRRDGITPYFTHLERVANRAVLRSGVKVGGEFSEKLLIVGYFHDYLESGGTIDKLRELGLDDDVIAAISLLTKAKGVDYFIYLNGIKQNELARLVKVADMLDNISDDPTDKQILKYSKGLSVLLKKA